MNFKHIKKSIDGIIYYIPEYMEHMFDNSKFETKRMMMADLIFDTSNGRILKCRLSDDAIIELLDVLMNVVDEDVFHSIENTPTIQRI